MKDMALFVLFLAAKCLVLVGLFSCANASDSTLSQMLFRNGTDATFRVGSIVAPGNAPVDPVIVKPNSDVSLAVPAGLQVFDLIAFRTDPVRIHRVEILVPENDSGRFDIIPHFWGVYVLEDADSLAFFATLPGEPPPRTSPLPDKTEIAGRCQSSVESETGTAIWDESAPLMAQFYHQNGDYLCATDGSTVFLRGEIYLHFICRSKWRECARDADGDALPLPLERSSNRIDTATRLAKLHAPRAYFVRTVPLEWLKGARPTSRMTDFYIFHDLTGMKKCPMGYRLRNQAICINITDELKGVPAEAARAIEPLVVK